ncbi:MAG: hypothetical protein IT381_14500 [Deltaproteobacteria bacterium]|nr:hypothetical protein [Deltaproteobacteria bacterium]
MWILALMLIAAKPGPVPKELQRLSEDLQAIDFKVTKTDPNTLLASHWISNTKLPMPDRIYRVVLKQAATELFLEHWLYAGPDAAAAAKAKIDETVSSATLQDGAGIVVVSAAAESPAVKAVSEYLKCTKRPPAPSVAPKLKDYRIKERTLDRITEMATLASGERFAVSRGGCDHTGTSYRFFVEVKKQEAVQKARALLTKLAPSTGAPKIVEALAAALDNAPLDTDVKPSPNASVRVTYDDRGAEPTLTVEHFEGQ